MTSIIRIAFLLGMGFVALEYGYIWLKGQKGGMEAMLSIIGTLGFLVELFFNVVDQFFGSKEKPRLQFEEMGATKGYGPTRPCKNSPKDNNGYYIGRQDNGIYEWDLKWSYNLVVRNNSNYHAFNPKIHLKKAFQGISFPGKNNYQPDKILFFKERYALQINNLHEKEPIKAGEKNLIRINYSKIFQGTYKERDKALEDKIPPELKNFELLFELENGEGTSSFTLMKRKGGEWKAKYYIYKPLRYLI